MAETETVFDGFEDNPDIVEVTDEGPEVWPLTISGSAESKLLFSMFESGVLTLGPLDRLPFNLP